MQNPNALCACENCPCDKKCSCENTEVASAMAVSTREPLNQRLPVKSLAGMTLEHADTVLSLVSIAENSTTSYEKAYNYAERNSYDSNIRGVTVGIVGFTTGTGDLLMVIQALQKINPKHSLVKYIPALKKVNGSGSNNGIENLIPDIKKLGKDVQWRQAQWEIINKLYWNPAIAKANDLGLKNVISKGQLYDTILNFGNLNLIKRIKALPPSKKGDEVAWLNEFLDIKETIVTKEDKSLTDGNPDRVKMWRSILKSKNVKLSRPINNLVCYGDKFSIV